MFKSTTFGFFFVFIRSMWQRAGAVRLFVEHVTLFSEQDDGFNSGSVIRLWKVQSSLCLFIQTRAKNNNKQNKKARNKQSKQRDIAKQNTMSGPV